MNLTPTSLRPSLRQALPTHLKRLEAESVEIMREVIAEFNKPVMIYSIGKDSSVMLHLARKAFYPAPLPFPLLHVDTTWKFREMIQFRDETAQRFNLNLLVHVNQEGIARGINPFASGFSLHTDVMKTEALKQALDKYGFDAAFGETRRNEETSRANERIFSLRSKSHSGIHATSGPSCGTYSIPASSRAKRCEYSHCRIGLSSTCGTTSRWRRSPSYRSTLRNRGRSSGAAARGSWSMTRACRSKRGSSRKCVSSAFARSDATL